MRTLTRAALAALAALAAAAAAPPPAAHAQRPAEARVLESHADGTHLVVIGRDTLLAVPASMARRALEVRAELDGARAALAARDSLLADCRAAADRLEEHRRLQTAYAAELEVQLGRWRELAEGYRALAARAPRLSLEAGLGAVGARPAALLGAGVRRLRVWALLQEGRAGGLVGFGTSVF